MTRFTDGERVVDVTMKTWNGSGYSPCFEHDVFNCGSLRHNDELDCYEVEDVDEVIDAAKEWGDASSYRYSFCDIFSGWKYFVHIKHRQPKEFELYRYFLDEDGNVVNITYEYIESANFDELGLDNNSDMTSIIAAIDAYLEDAIGFAPEYEVVW